ncbi:MAG: M1 family metallopeptidase [Bacteroidota bacterium]
MPSFPLLALLLASQVLLAQADYFQQRTDFEIHATLDDEQHTLHANWRMTYTNHSPDTLDWLYLHLWPNAYSSRNTAFARQQANDGDTRFYYALDKDLGYIDSLDFVANGESLTITPTELGPDVVRLELAEALPPGASLTIASPFRLKFPASFSRLGHLGQSYQVTQWFPKPAVYDCAGWHPMAYLNYGEFYSEFGDFDVYLTLPANYLVGATGRLETAVEREFLRQKAQASAQQSWSIEEEETAKQATFPASSASRKTLHYHAERVHDFAWFADKRFHVLHDTIQRGERTIDAWSFFTDYQADLWQASMTYIKRATHFYSDYVGEYPYPQVTAVQSALSAGSGMEYPMVTVIGSESSARSLDHVLAHEIGHNWFYGILATNERDHAWLDEGFNSYYDHRYDAKYYAGSRDLPEGLLGGSPASLDDLGHRYFGCQRHLQAPATPSEDLRVYNYFITAYSMPALGLQQLEDYWGTARLDRAVQTFYDRWQFRHPQPADVQATLEEVGGDDLDWFFQHAMGSTDFQDYALRKVTTGDSTYLTVENKGQMAGPITVTAEAEGKETSYSWPGFTGKRQLAIPRANYTSIHLDRAQRGLDMVRSNNHWARGVRLPHWRLYLGVTNEERPNIFVGPLVGYNAADGAMPLLFLHNRGLVPRRLEWLLAPSFGTRSTALVGLGAARWRIPLDRWSGARELTLEGNFRHYHYRYFEPEDVFLGYRRASVTARLELRRKAPTTGWKRQLGLRWVGSRTEDLAFGPGGVFAGVSENAPTQVIEGFARWRKTTGLSPWAWTLTYEYLNYTDDFDRAQRGGKLRLEAEGKSWYDHQKAVSWRFFGGLFLHHTLEGTTFTPAPAFSLFDRGVEDYRYDNFYFDRSAANGVGSQQLGQRAGGFRAALSPQFPVGRSNDYLLSLNLTADFPLLPASVPLRPYVDLGIFGEPTFDGTQNTFLWNAGIALEWLDGKIGIYAPLLGSAAIHDRLQESSFFERVGFRVRLTDFGLWRLEEELVRW